MALGGFRVAPDIRQASEYDGLLHAAALNADLDLVDECLAAGADPNFADGNGLTALHLACFVGGEEGKQTIRWLLACGASPNPVAETFGTPLHVASRFGEIGGKADPNARDHAGTTALRTATAAWAPALLFEKHFRLAIQRECAAGGGGWPRGQSVTGEKRQVGDTFLTDDKEVGGEAGAGGGDAAGAATAAAAAGGAEGAEVGAGAGVGDAFGAAAATNGGDYALASSLLAETDESAGVKKGKKGGKGGKKGKGKTKAGMAGAPAGPPDAIGLAVLLLAAGADPRLEEEGMPRWVNEVWADLDMPGGRSGGVDLDALRDLALQKAEAEAGSAARGEKGGGGKGKGGQGKGAKGTGKK